MQKKKNKGFKCTHFLKAKSDYGCKTFITLLTPTQKTLQFSYFTSHLQERESRGQVKAANKEALQSSIIKAWCSRTAIVTLLRCGPLMCAPPKVMVRPINQLHTCYEPQLPALGEVIGATKKKKMRKLTSGLIPYTRKIPSSEIAGSKSSTRANQRIFQLPLLQRARWAVLTATFKKISSMENVSSTVQVWQSYNQLKSRSCNRNWQGNSSYLCCL